MRKIPTLFDRDWTGDRSRVVDFSLKRQASRTRNQPPKVATGDAGSVIASHACGAAILGLLGPCAPPLDCHAEAGSQ